MSGLGFGVVEVELWPPNDGKLEVGTMSGDSPVSLTTSEFVNCDRRWIVAWDSCRSLRSLQRHACNKGQVVLSSFIQFQTN